MVSLAQLLEGFEALKSQSDSQDRDLAHLKEAVLALGNFLWELDTEHKEQYGLSREDFHLPHPETPTSL